jgi:hypothetical protein
MEASVRTTDDFKNRQLRGTLVESSELTHSSPRPYDDITIALSLEINHLNSFWPGEIAAAIFEKTEPFGADAEKEWPWARAVRWTHPDT